MSPACQAKYNFSLVLRQQSISGDTSFIQAGTTIMILWSEGVLFLLSPNLGFGSTDFGM